MSNLVACDSGLPQALWGMRHPLDCIFAARSVVVVGATEKPGTVGRSVLWNLMSTPFGGPVYPVNANLPSVLGIKAYPSIKDVPEKVDLVVIASPAEKVPAVMGECADLGIPGAVILSPGFKETGAAGEELERQILRQARRGGMRIVGPNCWGVKNPVSGINASFANTMARRGNVAFISQSGALGTAILDWSLREMVGFSAFVSIGSMLDMGWGDLISYFGDDPNTKSIVIYMETVGDARAFLSAAREVALTKPIIILKAGRTEGAAKAAASHTGSLTGSDDVLEAAFKRCGVLRVNTIAELFYMAEVLAKQPRPQGNRLTVISNAGGPGVLATDSLLTSGGALAELSPKTSEELNQALMGRWSHANPIDLLDDAKPETYAKALEIAARDPNSDGLLVVLTPQALTDVTATAEKLKEFSHVEGKPVLASWMGGQDTATGEAILNRAGIPTFPYPDTAARVFTSMWRYADNLRALYETPLPSATPEETASGQAKAAALVDSVRKAGRTLLTECESKELLACYGIPTVPTQVAATEDEAARLAREIGFPCVLKVLSQTITHKSDVGGVALHLANEPAVRQAFRAIQQSVTTKAGAEHFQGVTVQKMIALEDGCELILGSSVDPQFGPVLLFGAGGRFVELSQDKALGLPPLNTTLARRMMEQTRIFRALQGVRGGAAVDLAALEKLMVGFSQLVAEQRWIKEIDLNPLFASAAGFVALDARVVLHDPKTPEAQLPKLAIRPYPTQYVADWTMSDGTVVTIRPIGLEDEPLMVKFHEGLSEQSVYLRYFSALKLSQRVAHDRLVRVCFNDYDREMVLVTDHKDPQTGQHVVIGVARLSRLHGLNGAEFALIISDHWQKRGLGPEMTRRLVEIARKENLSYLMAYALQENRDMQTLCKKLGFRVRHMPGDNECIIEMDL